MREGKQPLHKTGAQCGSTWGGLSHAAGEVSTSEEALGAGDELGPPSSECLPGPRSTFTSVVPQKRETQFFLLKFTLCQNGHTDETHVPEDPEGVTRPSADAGLPPRGQADCSGIREGHPTRVQQQADSSRLQDETPSQWQAQPSAAPGHRSWLGQSCLQAHGLTRSRMWLSAM